MGAWRLILYLAMALLSAPLSAQVEAPPAHETLDQNGVDNVRGTFTASTTDLSIGPAGRHGLTLRRRWGATGWDTTFARFTGGSGSPNVTLDGVTTEFDASGHSSSGATLNLDLNGTYALYTGRDGTIVNFAQFGYNTLADPLLVTSIAYPDGVQLTFHYKSVDFGYAGSPRYSRLQAVVSNTGYELKFKYLTDNFSSNPTAWVTLSQVTALNNAVESCSPDIDTCTYQTSWPQVNYVYVTIGHNYPANVYGYYLPTDFKDALGNDTHYSYGDFNGGSNLTGIRRPGAAGDDVTIGYNGSTVTSVSRSGVSWTYGYSQSGNSLTVTIGGPNGVARTIVSDQSTALVTDDFDGLGHHTAYEYDSSSRLSKVTAQDGNSAAYVYDDRGNVTQTTLHRKAYDTDPDIVTFAGYETGCSNPKTCNQPLWTKDGRGSQTDYAYDAGTGLLTSIDPPADQNGARAYVKYEYTSVSSPYGAGGTITLLERTKTCQTGGWGCGGATLVGTFSQYEDASGNFLPRSLTEGAHDGSLDRSTSYDYDVIGNMTAITDPNGEVTHSGYDAARRPLWTVGPDPDGSDWQRGKAIVNTYNTDGTLQYQQVGTAASDGGGFFEYFRTTYSYDSFGRKTLEVLGRNGTNYSATQVSYDGLGRPDCTAVRMNPSVYGSLPGACDLSQDGGFGADRITRNEYDAASRVTRTWAGYRTATAFHTDYDWTNNDKLHRIYRPLTDPYQQGNATTFEYDGLDRLQLTCYDTQSCSGASNYEQYGYDDDGNMTSRRLRDGYSMLYQYDARNRLTLATPPGYTWRDQPTSYVYDSLGNMTQANVYNTGNNMSVSMTYDALGRLRHEQQPFSSADYDYDLAGNLTYLGYGDGYWVTYSYDHAGRMRYVLEYGQNALAQYIWDEMGRRVALGRSNGAHSFYDYGGTPWLTAMTHDLAGTANDLSTGYYRNPAGQIVLKASSNDAYGWSQNYNVIRGYGANGLNQYTYSGTVALSYDGRGNLTGAPTPGTGGNGETSGQVSYAYTADNLIVAAGSNAFNYDTLGRMSMDQTDTRLFGYAGSQLLLVKDYNGNTVERYVYGLDEAPLVRYDGNGLGTRRWLYADERGSVVAVADDGGNATAINRYDEYGIPATSNDGRFGYTGQAWNRTLGMWNYKARIYSPTLGRFLQTDPIGYAGGMNLYNYVEGDPVNATDPSGTDACDLDRICMSGGGGAGYTCYGNCGGTAASAGNFGGPSIGAGLMESAAASLGAGSTNSSSSDPGEILVTATLRADNHLSDFGGAIGSIAPTQNVSLGGDMLERVQQLRDNVANGSAGEATAAEILVEAKYRILAQQVYIQTDLGLRITDFVTRNQYGDLVGYEVKTGFTARRSPLQVQKDISIATKGGTVISRGLGGVGLPYGSRIQFPTGVISIFDLVKF